jgi:hypothetical protein
MLDAGCDCPVRSLSAQCVIERKAKSEERLCPTKCSEVGRAEGNKRNQNG